MHAIIVIHPDWQLFEDGACVRFWADADVIALEGTDERLGHAVGLRAFDRRSSGDQADVAGEAASVVCGVAAPIIGEPFDLAGHMIYLTEAVLDGGDHEVTHVLGCDAACGRNVAHGFAVAAVEREGDAHLLAIVAADLQAVRAPSGVADIL